MTEKQQIEKVALEMLSRGRLKWVVAAIEESLPAHTWDIEVEVPDGHELMFPVPKGSLREMKESIRNFTEEEMDRLHIR